MPRLFGIPFHQTNDPEDYADGARFADGTKFESCPKFSRMIAENARPDKPDPIDPDFKRQWVTALRDGSFKQGKSALAVVDTHTEEARYCCLGVVCELKRVPSSLERAKAGESFMRRYYWTEVNFLPKDVAESIGLDRRNQRVLATMNDAGWTFSQIADLIEEVF